MGKTEEIRGALEDISKETLADALALFLGEGSRPVQETAGLSKPEFRNFAEAVSFLKKNYRFEEMEYFSTEADLVYVKAGERRVLLTDRNNGITGQTIPRRQYEQEDVPVSPGSEEHQESRKGSDDNGDDHGRFSNLEIWE